MIIREWKDTGGVRPVFFIGGGDRCAEHVGDRFIGGYREGWKIMGENVSIFLHFLKEQRFLLPDLTLCIIIMCKLGKYVI